MIKDITFCLRECGNEKCKRNKNHLNENDYVSLGYFEDCEEYIERKEYK